ncbi:helix-turn-helix domain-containing protein [Euzebyella marina]|uniref:Helix-turn-helix domain-containing protein n=1 Tax=Euzebyella marina TaxID=1761453 RepID=A0A3G2L5T2_9FLAO|nr:BLUF domain-containing protein [Euzebyella marina]AYN67625.1 helix-turn-helix domain-containing protein [Euzebyella marina]
MFKINEECPSKHLRKLALALGGDFKEGVGASSLILDNENGKGYINLYELFPGIIVRTYNIELRDELVLSLTKNEFSPLYLIYCLEGSYRHRYESGSREKIVSEGRNLISLTSDLEEHTLTLPASVKLRISVIVLLREKLNVKANNSKGNVSSIMRDIVLKMEHGDSYRFIGGLKNPIGKHAKILIENRRTDLAGKLITESATYATLAAQLDDHDGLNGSAKHQDISDNELERVVHLCTYISKNIARPHTVKELAHKSGIYPRKLQEAFRYLFNQSVAECVKNMRLEKAKELLETTNIPISNVCDEVGLNSKSYFSKIFVEKYGMLPRDYRSSFEQSDWTFELTYKSKAKLYLSDTEVAELVKKSDRNNKIISVTGCLIHYGDDFFQLIEGPKKKVLELFDLIGEDSRHDEVEVLWKGPRKDRIFDDWGLILISDRKRFSNDDASKDLGIDMKTILNTDSKTAIKDLQFWQRIRDRIRVQVEG